ncbi:MAG TPA: hypothetical protein VMB71_15855 [Acetobacteraceae bacterium]|nr:hypothetical protein [Acetobacteraceae bacterium]
MRTLRGVLLLLCGVGVPALAFGQAPLTPAPTPGSAPEANVSDYFDSWFQRVDEAQASQPHWMTPLVTVTPRLEEEVRVDVFYERLGNGNTLDSFGNGKGLEFIPTTTNEVILNAPTYIDRWGSKRAVGFGDWPFILVKQRLFSANEANGNYIVSAFLGLQAPIGNAHFTNNAWIVTPTIAAGKGWGDFDVQATESVAIPTAYEKTIGTSFATNVAFQYHLLDVFWPEVEVNWTDWADGERGGKNQVFITPGIILGRFHLGGRLKAIFGVGYQVAVAPKLEKEPITPTYDESWVFTARLAF